ncbi:hypothetical protein PO909_016704 [Leuciscus waleckii]
MFWAPGPVAADPAELRGPGSRRKGWENGESGYLYFAISSMSGESPHELHSQKLDDVSVVCGDSSPLPKRAPETQRLIQCLRPPALGSTPAVQKLSDVALICHTCPSLSLLLSAQSLSQTLLQNYISGA